MRKKCLLKNCKKKTYGENLKPDVTFHRLPKDENLIQKWIYQFKKKNKECSGFSGNYEITFSKSSVVCSDHIKNKCFEQSYLQRKRKQEKVPTFFILVCCVQLSYHLVITFLLFAIIKRKQIKQQFQQGLIWKKISFVS